MRHTTVRPVAGLLISLLLFACQSAPPPSPAGPAIGNVESPALTARPAQSQSRSPMATPSHAPSPTVSPTTPFTVLLLGADSEGRTDAIMVVGIDPTTKRITYASVPRDTVNVPLPGGGPFKNRTINEFYNQAAKRPGTYPEGPGRATADAIGTLLGIKIDYYARTTFGGFTALVNSVGKVPITLPAAIHEDFLQTGPNTFGITFSKGSQSLDGRKALIFVRIRHADTDFARQRRQQSFVTAAGLFILKRPEIAAPLMAAAKKHLLTDFPADRVAGYQAAMAGLDPRNIEGVVLGPSKYESKANCSCGYALAPKLAAIRAKAADLFPWAVAH